MAPALWRTIVVSLALSAAAVVVVVFWLGDTSGIRALSRIPLASLSGSFVLLLATFLVGGARLWFLLRIAGVRIHLMRATRAFILGLFGAAVTPGGGGNAPAIVLALVRDGVPTPLAWSATVYSSIADLLFFAWALPASAALLFQAGYLTDIRLVWLILGLSVGSIVLWYLLAYQLPKLARLGGHLFSLDRLKRWRRPLMKMLASIGRATTAVTGARLSAHVVLQLLTAAMHLGLYAIFFLLATGLGAELLLWVNEAVLVAVSATSYLIPTPGASGYLELALSYAFARELTPATLTASVVAYRAIAYYAAVLLGGILGGSVLTKELAKRLPAQ